MQLPLQWALLGSRGVDKHPLSNPPRFLDLNPKPFLAWLSAAELFKTHFLSGSAFELRSLDDLAAYLVFVSVFCDRISVAEFANRFFLCKASRMGSQADTLDLVFSDLCFRFFFMVDLDFLLSKFSDLKVNRLSELRGSHFPLTIP